MSILDVSEMVVKYGAVEAVRGVSFDLFKGEVATIIGANGAGKTTILKAIMGIIKIAKGSIKTASAGAIHQLPPHKIANLGVSYVPEGREILATLSVEDNLAIGGYTVKDKKQFAERIEYVYEKFPVLKDRRKQLVKIVKNMAEESRISIRNARRDSNERLKNMEKEKEITEDEYHNGLKDIQKLTDDFIAKVEEILDKKEKEIMEV